MEVRLHRIKKHFKRDAELFKDVNVIFRAGDLILIRGTNGCGKSTLLKIMAKLMMPDSGEVSYHAINQVGALIENPSFIENETLRFNLQFLFHLRNDYDDRKVQELCQDFCLEINSKKKMKHYSIGMKQKAGIIQAVMENQDLILLDEPTRGLDEKRVKSFNDMIHRLQEQQKIIVICAHDGFDGIEFNRKFRMDNGTFTEH